MSKRSGQPDILFILTDQWNPRMLGCYGDDKVRTPNIDQLAAEGMRFDAAYTQSPVCMPSRVSLASSQYPHNHGLWSNMTGFRFPAERITIHRDVKNAGYFTAKVGKFHYEEPGMHHDDPDAWYRSLGLDHACELPEPYGTPWYVNPYSEHLKSKGLLRGFLDDLCRRFESGDATVVGPAPIPPEDHADSFVAQNAIKAIDACPEGKPLNLCVSFPGPHSPFDAPGEYATMFAPEDMVLAPNVPETIRQGDHCYDRNHIRRAQANYYGKIKLIDDAIGAIIGKLIERGNWNNTFVVFTADHGDNLGAHGRFFKGTFNDESVRLPLILRWPGHIPEGGATDALAQLIDINPTLVDAAGGKQSPHKCGNSLMPLATGSEDRVHDCIFSEIGNSGHRNYMVRDPQYKWFRRSGEEHLYDLRNDPYELNNLIDDPEHHSDASGLRARLGEFLMESQVNFADTYVSLFGRINRELNPGETIGSMLRKRFEKIHFQGNQSRNVSGKNREA